MLQIFAALALIALGMGVDAYYQRRILIAECDAYETGYQQGKKEESAKRSFQLYTLDEIDPGCYEQKPSMAAPVEMPPAAAERLRTHGRATWRVER